MNYRHAFHAGNFADVIKHVALVAILQHLKKKDKPFRVIDTHAGRGLYDLEGGDSGRTGEAAQGIARLGDLRPDASLPAALGAYLDLVRGCGAGHYPGSPLIAALALRETDRLIAVERHADEAKILTAVLARFRNTKVFCADGYARLPALLPPPERRGLVLLDPPYERPDEFARAAAALAAARRRFATGIYLLWFPAKSPGAAAALCGEVLAGGTGKVVRIMIDVGAGAAGGRSARGDDKDRLSAAGLLVVNPPFGFAEEMRAAAVILAPRLGAAPPSSAEISVALS